MAQVVDKPLKVVRRSSAVPVTDVVGRKVRGEERVLCQSLGDAQRPRQ